LRLFAVLCFVFWWIGYCDKIEIEGKSTPASQAAVAA
jgi:hypothetical protein